MCAFEKSTINVGGNVSYSSIKCNSDADAMTILSFTPQAGYFFVDNIAGDLLLNYTSMDDGNNNKMSTLSFGIGGRYFFNKIYAGLGFMMESVDYDSYKISGNYLDIKAGYLVPLVENVFVDLGLDYMMGLGDYGGDGSGSNEESGFQINAGLQIFFKK